MERKILLLLLGIFIFCLLSNCGERPQITAPTETTSEIIDNSWVGEFFIIPEEQIQYNVSTPREVLMPTQGDTTEVVKVSSRTQIITGQLTSARLQKKSQQNAALVLVLNGEARKIGEIPAILAAGGNFQAEFRWNFGVNTYRLLVVRDFQGNNVINENQVEGGSSPVTVIAPFAVVPPTRLFVSLLWDRGVQNPNTQGNWCDLDLHIWDPINRHCYYDDKTGIPNGILDIDNTWGFGPETFTLMKAINGDYVVRVRYFSGVDNVNARVRVSIDEGPIIEYGPYPFDSTMARGNNEENDWDVVTIPMVEGEAELTYNASTYSGAANSFFPGGPYFVRGKFTITTAQQVKVDALTHVLTEPHGGWWISNNGIIIDGYSNPDGKPVLAPGTYYFGVDGPATWGLGKASGILRYNEPTGTLGKSSSTKAMPKKAM